MASPTAAVSSATLSHGANVLRALARNLESLAPGGTEPPLDHASARDAVTLLGWRGECTSEELQEALDLSQPACVRVVDRLAAAGLVARRRTPGDRRLRVGLTTRGQRAASRLVRASGAGVERALRDALPEGEDLEGFVAALDRLATVVFGEATDTVRFCRSCDVDRCVQGPRGCPSDAACRANLGRE
jgi:DNA-binding MarR family transcriptional regulator